MRNRRRKWWIITDTHFGHERMFDLCHRPANFSELIFKRWKEKVGENDWVIHLGDVAWPKYADKLIELPGHKVLVRGNHDVKTYTWYQERGFDLVVEEFVMKYEGLNILFSHQPVLDHYYDLNIHGHLHNILSRDCGTKAYCLSLEDMGYDVFSLNHIVGEAKKIMTKNSEVKTDEEI